MKTKITKRFVEQAKPPVDKDQIFYRDAELKGFALRVTANGTKSFVVEKNIGNKIRRITLGKFGALTTEQARKEAQKIIGQIAIGVDPIAEKQALKASTVTLNDVFQDYLKARKNLKAKTLYDYNRVLNIAFATWKNKPLLSVTKDKVIKHHEYLAKEHGQAYSNLAMRILRALFNFAIGEYEDAQGKSVITDNPVKSLSDKRAWYRINRRQTLIKAHELSAWYQGVQQLENETLRDYLLLIVMSGLRRQEAAKLKFDSVCFSSKTFTVHDTKNHESHTLPMSDYLYQLFQRRFQNRINEYVFHGSGSTGHIIEPRKQMAHVTQFSGVEFTIHDLRRTFISIAESLDVPAYALKRLMNHKMNNDITSGYIITDVERLRKPMQKINEYLLQCMGVIQSAEIISIHPAIHML